MSTVVNDACIDVDPLYLPESLAEIIDAIELPATLKLVERFGGIRLYVPMVEPAADDHPLVATIGRKATQTLCRVMPGDIVELPRAVDYLRRLRDNTIRASRGKVGAGRLARQYGLTRRHVMRIWAEAESENKQVALF